MKAIIVLCLVFATAIAYPATHFQSSSQEDSNESEFFNPLTRKGLPSVIEVDVGDSDEDSFFFPSFFRPLFVNPFPQMKFPSLFPNSFFGGLTSIFNKVPDDAKVTNSTSVVKIVDGHKVTVNSTTYENEKNGAVFKYEVVEVTRLDEPKEEGGEKSTEETVKTETNEETSTKTNESPEDTSVKTDNNSLDNEILREEWIDDGGYHGGNFGENGYKDLSNDIRVNALAEEAALRSGLSVIPKDIEIFKVPIDENGPSNYVDDSDFQDEVKYIDALEDEYPLLPVGDDLINYFDDWELTIHSPDPMGVLSKNEFSSVSNQHLEALPCFQHPKLFDWELAFSEGQIYLQTIDRLSHQALICSFQLP